MFFQRCPNFLTVGLQYSSGNAKESNRLFEKQTVTSFWICTALQIWRTNRVNIDLPRFLHNFPAVQHSSAKAKGSTCLPDMFSGEQTTTAIRHLQLESSMYIVLQTLSQHTQYIDPMLV